MQKEFTLKTPTKEYIVDGYIEQSVVGTHLSLSLKKPNDENYSETFLNTFISSPDIIASALQDAIKKEKGFYELRRATLASLLVHTYLY